VKAAELRLLWQDETTLHRMTSSAPPISQNVQESSVNGRAVYDVILEEEPADRIGQSLSGEMVGLIAGIRADFLSYGPRHPVRRALADWDRTCRRRHRATSMQWFDHSQGPICGSMIYDVANGTSILWCAYRYQVAYPRAERLIASGLRFIGDALTRAEEASRGAVHDREGCDVCREEEA
jgi:hypothetical protein